MVCELDLIKLFEKTGKKVVRFKGTQDKAATHAGDSKNFLGAFDENGI